VPVIPSQRSKAHVGDAIVLDLGDLKRQGDEMLDRARREAERIVEEARRERERLIEGAAEKGRAEGFERGRVEGLEQGRAEGKAEAMAQHSPELNELIDRWTEALAQFENDRSILLSRAMDNVVLFAVEFAKRITKRAVGESGESAKRQLKAALGTVLNPTRIVIRVHPDDRQVIDDALPELMSCLDGLEHAELLTDPELTPGSCVLRSGAQEVDADIQRQIDRLVETVLPAGAMDDGGSRRAIDDAA